MVLPVIEHRLTKIGHVNRRRFIRIAVCFSGFASLANLISSTTNNWLYTSEVLKYYVFPNATDRFDESVSIKPTYFKNATLGPWVFCWLDPVTPFHCNKIDLFSNEEPADVTSSIEQSVRKSLVFILSGLALDILGFISIFTCLFFKKPYKSLFATTLTHILAGIANFSCIIVYMSAVSKEVGNKVFPASEMDDPLFHYSFGYSLIFLKLSFLLTEMAALFSVLVYMSKRDERTFHRYRIHTIMKNIREKENENMPDRYYDHSRMQCLQRASRNPSIDASFNSISSRKPLYYPGMEPVNSHETTNLANLLSQPFMLPVSTPVKTMYL